MVEKAVVMAGGNATRLHSLTKATNKHMLPVYDRPMIQHVVETLVASGISDILILLNNQFAQPIMQLLEHGDAFGCNITYAYESGVCDVGNRIARAKSFIGGECFLLMLGDSFYVQPLNLSNLPYPHMWVMPLGPGFDDPRKYAEVTLSPDKKQVLSIAEQPEFQRTGIIQTGAWVFGPDVCELAQQLRRDTNEREVQVRTIVRHYLEKQKMYATMLRPQSFLDLGTIEALYLAQSLMRDMRQPRRTAAE